MLSLSSATSALALKRARRIRSMSMLAQTRPLTSRLSRRGQGKDGGLCRECNLPVTSGCIILEDSPYKYPYHPKCFFCKKCNTALKESNFHQHQGLPYCEKCILIVNPKGGRVTGKVKDMGFKFS
eukprot:m.56882 g.56882  ORF g.56882 m.56882 type:complete len:125 (+) comp7041_c0_seq3:308-682(+)